MCTTFRTNRNSRKSCEGGPGRGVNRGMQIRRKKDFAYKYLDLLAFNETRLHDIIADNEVSVGGWYDIVRCDRPLNGRKGGGVYFYILSNINHDVRKDLSI